MRARALIRRLTLAAVLLCAGVVVLGAYVRLTAAGLGCPDWPGCYGHFTPAGAQATLPDGAIDIGKAWREMAHRYAASTLGLLIVVIAALAIATRRERIVGLGYALALLGIVVVQGMLGMLTVTWYLKPLIVTLHLAFGLTTLAMLWWLWLSLRTVDDEKRASGALQRWVLVALVALGVQITLGGWTSSNYAAMACPDFPTCQGEWWPRTDYADAFVLWRGLGINYEGGVLDHPARVAIHLTHRIGAVAATLALLLTALAVLRQPALARARPAGIAVLIALALQLAIGIAMVLRAFPLSLATLHNAGAALLLLATLALYKRVSRFC